MSPTVLRNALAVSLLALAACGETPPPAITAQPASVTALAGDTATFTATASGGALSYQWLRNGTSIAGATGARYTTLALSAPDDHATFAVEVNGPGGAVMSEAATLRVNWIEIGTAPQSTGLPAGARATFTVAAAGSGALAYQWKRDGAAIAGATSAIWSISTALTLDDGNYSCAITSRLAGTTLTIETAPARLVVLTAPTISAQPRSQTVAAGSPVSLTVGAASRSTLSYQWQKDGVDVPNATSSTYAIASASAADNGAYRVVITFSEGIYAAQALSAEATLAVATPPALVSPANKLVGEGSGFSLVVSATAAPGMSAPSIQWWKDGAPIPSATSATYSVAAVTPADAGAYTAVATSTVNGLAASASTTPATVSVLLKPTIIAQPQGGEINAAGTFIVSVAATGSDTLGYQWMLHGAPIASATSSSFTVASAGPTDAGDYTCVVSNTRSGVSATATSGAATLVVHAPPLILTQPADVNARETETATFTVVAAGSGLTYQWHRGGTSIAGATAASYTTPPVDLIADQGATYGCVISNGFLPDVTTRSATLTVGPAPTVFTQSVSTLALGEGVILSWKFAGTATLQEGSDAPAAVASGGSLVAYPNADTTWTLAVTNHGGSETRTASVAVKSYTPKHMYVLNQYPHNANQPANVPPDSIAHFTLSLKPGQLGSPDVYLPPGAAATGRPAQSTPTGSFPIHVAATPDESRLYVANHGDATISAYAVNASTGALTAIAGSPFAIGNDAQPFASAVDPAGANLYVACKDGVRVFSIAASTGALTAQPLLDAPIPGRVEGDLLMQPSGRFLYVADHGHDAVQVYAVDGATGALTYVSSAVSPGGPTALTFDRAGSRLFTRGTDSTTATGGGSYNAALRVFGIDPFSGALTQLSVYRGYGPNDVLSQATGNPDSKMPFVPGDDPHLHSLAYSRRPGVDVLYDAYGGDVSISPPDHVGFTMSGYSISGGTIGGDQVNSFLGSPYLLDMFGYRSLGGSIVLDRSGAALVLTSWMSVDAGINIAAYYPTDPADGSLLAISGVQAFYIEYSVAAGAAAYLVNQPHGVFTGALQ